MPAFRNEADMRRAIAAAGFDDIADHMVATARPALLFVRSQVLDDPLAPGVSKIGGLPDLPPGFAWPSRQASPHADRRERDVRARHPASERQEPPSELDLAADHYADVLIDACRRTFPLAFRAQLDLAQLAQKEGFDPDLPRRGVLSIFEDPTGSSIRTFWHDVAAESLVRQSPPDDLIALSDAYFSDQIWARLDSAELLLPHSALTIAHHWIEAAGDRWGEMYDFIHEPTEAFYPERAPDSAGCGGNLGDRLGGWPDPIQKDPEAEFAGRSRPTAPGDDRVRHLFTWGGEHFGDTRLPALEKGGDGLTHVLIPRDALLARRFEAAGSVYQGD